MASQWLPDGLLMASQWLWLPNGFLHMSTVNWDMFACTDCMAKIGSDVMDLIHVFLLVPGQVGGSLQVLTREGPPLVLTPEYLVKHPLTMQVLLGHTER